MIHNGGQRPPTMADVMTNLREVILADLDQQFPGALRIAKDLDEETKEIFNHYRKNCMTEIHALRIANLIVNDLTTLGVVPIHEARGLLLKAEEMLFRHLITNEGAKESWAQRHELKRKKMEQAEEAG